MARFPSQSKDEFSSPEALLLAGAGLESRRPARNLFLRAGALFGDEFSKPLLVDLIEARLCTEVSAASLAARRRTDGQLVRMEALVATDGRRVNGESDAAGEAFHRELAAASGNVVLQQAIDFLVTCFGSERRAVLRICGDAGRDCDEHRGILDAVRAGDAPLAAERMGRHLERQRDLVHGWDPDEHPV